MLPGKKRVRSVQPFTTQPAEMHISSEKKTLQNHLRISVLLIVNCWRCLEWCFSFQKVMDFASMTARTKVQSARKVAQSPGNKSLCSEKSLL